MKKEPFDQMVKRLKSREETPKEGMRHAGRAVPHRKNGVCSAASQGAATFF